MSVDASPVVATAAPSEGGTAYRLLQAWWGFSMLATVIGVGRHLVGALAEHTDQGGVAAVPWSAWLWAALHLIAAIVSLPVGERLIALAYPERFRRSPSPRARWSSRAIYC